MTTPPTNGTPVGSFEGFRPLLPLQPEPDPAQQAAIDHHTQRIKELEARLDGMREERRPQSEPAPPPAAKPGREVHRQVAALRAERRHVQATARRWAVTVIAVSTVITAFGSGNAHDVLARHHTPEPWGWFLYPALEAGLIVEIQIGGALAALGRRVAFWGAALRIVTALAAVTVCVFGPAERGDVAGAVLHAIGPVVQFWLAEFLAAARKQFKEAAEDLETRAVRLLQPPPIETAKAPQSQRAVSPRHRSQKRRETKPNETKAKPSQKRETRETAPPRETEKQKVSPIGDPDRDQEVSRLVALMKQRGGPDEVSLDRDVVPMLSHLSRATCDRRLKRAREQYRKSA